MNQNKIRIDAIATALSILWLVKFQILFLPFFSLIYFIYRASNLKKIDFNNYKFILLTFIFIFIYLGIHISIGEINVIKSFGRFFFPFLISTLNLFVLNEYKKDQFIIYIKTLLWVFNFVAILDFSIFFQNINYLLTAQFNPYLLKAKTLLFSDGNWLGYLLTCLEFITICIKVPEAKISRYLRYFLIYISGSRSAFVTLVFFKIYQIIRRFLFESPLMNKIQKKFWPLLNSRSFCYFLTFSVVFLLPFLFLKIIPYENLDLSDNNISFSLKDGSFRTKLYLLKYATKAVYDSFILFFGNGISVVSIKTDYSGHSLIGSFPELGILGTFIIISPFIIYIFNLRNYCLPQLMMLLLLSSFSFYPYAFLTPIYTLLFFISYKFRRRKLCFGQILNL